jgi:hypothetical protein
MSEQPENREQRREKRRRQLLSGIEKHVLPTMSADALEKATAHTILEKLSTVRKGAYSQLAESAKNDISSETSAIALIKDLAAERIGEILGNMHQDPERLNKEDSDESPPDSA